MQNSQSGNVLFYILIAVVLLAALSFAVSQSGRGNLGQVNDEKTRLLATEIMEYAGVVSNATAQLRLRGVKDVDLCFDDPGWGNANYTQASCSDNAKKIFHLSGGGITWARAPSEAMDAAATPDNLWHIYGDNEIEEVGTTCGTSACSDLILLVDELREDVCMKINELLGVTPANTAPPTDTDIGTTYFVGTFGYTQTIGDEAGGAAIKGKTAGCFQNVTDSKYTFYKVLEAR